ncbi:MAG: hypothetical protein AWM53_02097 [Candidatus Dichloromethanomonas elyunquensis]|nr:MAG: hypothetical protein AWM53_02097 [Candidatus Dichloromethanomonas elyunquensis]
MRHPVGENEAVAAEIPVAGNTLRAEVSAISPEFFTCRVVLQQSLVNPVPNKRTLQLIMAVNGIPVIDKVA